MKLGKFAMEHVWFTHQAEVQKNCMWMLSPILTITHLRPKDQIKKQEL